MSRPMITTIMHTIKSGVPRTYTVGPKTLIVGPEGSGKTALLHAIRLALSRRTSDVQGRGVEDATVADPELLVTLGVPGADISAVVTFDDGLKATWMREWDGAGWGKAACAAPPYVDAQRCFPVDNARMALRGGKDAATFFLGIDGADLASAKELVGGTSWDKLLGELELTETSASAYLNAVVAQAKRKKLDAQAEARRFEKIAEAPEPPYVSDADVAAATTDSLPHALWKLIQLDTAAVEAATAAEAAQNALEAFKVEPEPRGNADDGVDNAERLNAIRRGILTTLDAALELDPELDFCLLCGDDHPTEHLHARAKLTQERIDALEAEIVGALTSRGTRAAWCRTRDQLESAVNGADATAEAAQAAYGEAWAATEAKYGVDLDRAAWPDMEPAAVDTLELVQQRAAHAEWRSAGEHGKLARLQASNWGRLEERALAAQRTLARRRLDPFVAKVDPYLLPGEHLHVIERWGGVDTFIPALAREGEVPRPDLSGMERTRMLFALAMANLPPEPHYAALIPDDRDRTFHTFRQWMTVLAAAPVQVFLTTAEIPDTLTVDSAWTVIRLGG